MASSPTVTPAGTTNIKGKIVEAEVKPTVDPARPLPLVCGLYCIETSEGYWLCAYYGMNRSVFDYLPQKGAEIEESKLGITFKVREFVTRHQFAPGMWEEFKKTRFMGLKGA
ncbi:MAG TPA: hypothetical protein VG028_16420 [Terriglobia bacterium]|nr:hypothetical protein [Terriglobia bacterium]